MICYDDWGGEGWGLGGIPSKRAMVSPIPGAARERSDPDRTGDAPNATR